MKLRKKQVSAIRRLALSIPLSILWTRLTDVVSLTDLNDRTPGRYKYRKPAPKSDEVASTISTTKRPCPSETTGRDSKREKAAAEESGKDTSVKKDSQPTASRNLLSFGDDDEEEDWLLIPQR